MIASSSNALGLESLKAPTPLVRGHKNWSRGKQVLAAPGRERLRQDPGRRMVPSAPQGGPKTAHLGTWTHLDPPPFSKLSGPGALQRRRAEGLWGAWDAWSKPWQAFAGRNRQGAYDSNMECLKHLATQVAAHCLSTPPHSCLEGSMEWFRGLLQANGGQTFPRLNSGLPCQVSFNHDSAVVIVLDQFEKFCRFTRQTLLYNLFNLAQEMSLSAPFANTCCILLSPVRPEPASHLSLTASW